MRDRISELQAEVERLRRRVEQRPVLATSPRSAFKFVEIVSGNTLETGQTGVLYEATVSSVPSAYDPDVTSSFVDGIGRGTLYINGVAQTGYVLVVNSDSGSFRNALRVSDVMWVGDLVAIPVDGGGSVHAYPVA